ncbi:MAG: potassium-transporting ATPase subunit C [Pirellulales bacterium]|nr:potassium-transporting ATPase subunit C [Pirellulales bacterium]
MNAHVRANLWLLVLTIAIGAVAYPAMLLGVGRVLFAEKAEGSLLKDAQGNVVGSRLIAQPFRDARYFQPRPSAVSYNAAATGGSNWGANNPNLRKRVLKQLGLVLKYRSGEPVGPDVASWVREQLRANPKVLAQWHEVTPDLSAWWVAADSANDEFVTKWASEHPDDVAKWRAGAEEGAEATAADLAGLFFASYANGQSTTWPETNGEDLQSAFFEAWWNAHADADVEKVPSDLVMASGCGLDPDITVKGAKYQLERVSAAWAEARQRDPATVRQTIEKLIDEHAHAPLGGVAGVPLVNVLELNIAVRDAMQGTTAGAN